MSNPVASRRDGEPLDFWGISNGGVNRRFRSVLDSSYLGVHVGYLILEMMLFWMEEHFVEVRGPE